MTPLRPSKKVVPVLIACLLALGAVVFAAEYSNTSGMTGSKSAKNSQNSDTFDTKDSKTGGVVGNSNASAADSEFLKKISNLDDDGDGIKNWEETLAGLENDDSTSGSIVTSGYATQEENLSETEKFSREFFGKYLEAKRAGTLDQEALVEDLVNSQTSTTRSKKYSFSDLKLVPEGKTVEENEKNMKKYGNTFGLVLLNNKITALNNEYEILNRAVSEKSEAELQKLAPAIARYENIVQGLKLVGVPVSAALAHLDVLNSFDAIKNDVSGFKKIFSDPIVGLANIKMYGENTAALNSAISELKNIFAEQNITFTQSEYGFALTNAI